MDISAFYREYCCVQDKALLSALVEKTRIRILDKNTTVVEPGSKTEQMLLLGSGIVRSFFWGNDDRTYTDGFYSKPGTLLTFGHVSAQEQVYGMKTVSCCQIMELSAETVATLMEQSVAFMQMYCQLLDQMLCVQWQEKTAQYQYSSLQRYLRFLKCYPNWKGQIGSRYIADYIGIAPESLSRLRHRLREEKNL